ncbi:required for drug-induced death protein 1 [Leuresthes tenuis]|uniref:required for drug-induced death protein 1 n=1 Tax=Leuresthes tenuis TaxID=355514 RepID=UPI003B5149B4
MGAQEQEEDGAPSGGKKPQKTSKEVYFCVLPDKYEPLIEEEERDETAEERQRRKEEKKRKRRKRCKKYRKNVGKALRYSWRCLLAGLQNMMPAYSAVATVVTEVNRTSGSKA